MSDRFQDTMRLVREVVTEAFREYKAEEADDKVATRVADVLNGTFAFDICVDVVFVDGMHKLAFFSTDQISYNKDVKLETMEEVATWLLYGKAPAGG